jgi:hypothetical protein
MDYVITTPEALAATAADVARIGSSITGASAAAAGPTSGLLTAAGDEVSAAVAKLFGGYAQRYQEAVRQAVAYQGEFASALAAAGSVYAQAEAANTALVATVSNPLGALLGQSPIATGGPTAAATTALILGGTFDPVPDQLYLQAIFKTYIQPLFSSAANLGLSTPEEFWPVTPTLGTLTFGESVGQGVAALNTAISHQITGLGNNAVVFGYSQSATIATNEINALMAAGSPYQGHLNFVLVGDPNNPVGGILTRFPGFYIPALDVAFNGATPPNSPYPTWIYTAQYDGIANAPQYPLNILSDINAFMGYFYVHGTYPMMMSTDVANAVHLPTSPDYTGSTNYYMFMTQNLPLLQPIRDIPFVGPPIADIFQPDLRVLVDMGYADYGPGGNYANIPTPAGLFSLPNPFTVIPDLANGLWQGPYGAAVDIGVESGLLSPSYFPNTYPWVPSIDPHLNVSFGQSSTTLLSTLSGDLGNVLDLIPPIFNGPPIIYPTN